MTRILANDRGLFYFKCHLSTPVKEYREFNGMRLPSFAYTIYHRPDGDFCYGEFEIKSVEYNCKVLI